MPPRLVFRHNTKNLDHGNSWLVKPADQWDDMCCPACHDKQEARNTCWTYHGSGTYFATEYDEDYEDDPTKPQVRFELRQFLPVRPSKPKADYTSKAPLVALRAELGYHYLYNRLFASSIVLSNKRTRRIEFTDLVMGMRLTGGWGHMDVSSVQCLLVSTPTFSVFQEPNSHALATLTKPFQVRIMARTGGLLNPIQLSFAPVDDDGEVISPCIPIGMLSHPDAPVQAIQLLPEDIYAEEWAEIATIWWNLKRAWKPIYPHCWRIVSTCPVQNGRPPEMPPEMFTDVRGTRR